MFQNVLKSNSLNSKLGVSALTLASIVTLGGCAAATGGKLNAAGTETSGGTHLAVKMHSSIFLQPVAPKKRVVYIEGHNTSSASNINFKPDMVKDLAKHGYRVTDNPNKANFMLMYNVRYLGTETKKHTMQGALIGGYGGAIAGVAASNNYDHMASNAAGAGLVGAAIGAGIGYLNRTNAYLMVVDIQLEQRNKHAVSRSTTNAHNGMNNTTRNTGAEIHGWAVYKDRIAATAHGRRLAFKVAKPVLSREIARELSGLF